MGSKKSDDGGEGNVVAFPVKEGTELQAIVGLFREYVQAMPAPLPPDPHADEKRLWDQIVAAAICQLPESSSVDLANRIIQARRAAFPERS